MEPERPIEKLLRDYSRKRKGDAGEPLELHPATRRLLQAEVARKHAATTLPPPSQPFWATLMSLWPRLIWGLAVLTVLGIIVALLVPSLQRKPQSFYAQDESAPAPAVLVSSESLTAETTATTPAATTAFKEVETVTNALADQAAPLRADSDAQTPSDQKTEVAANLASPPSNAPLAAAAAAETAEADAFRRRYGLPPAAPPAESAVTLGIDQRQSRLRAKDNYTPLSPAPLTDAEKQVAISGTPVRSEQKLQTAPAQSKPAGTSTLQESPGKFAANAAPGVGGEAKGQRFVQVASADKAKRDLSKTSPVADSLLTSFQVERDGMQFRIVDADGSVYAGLLRPTSETRAPTTIRQAGKETPASGRASTSTRSAATTPSTNESYSFTAEGTNGTLKERVVFVGNLLIAPSASADRLMVTNSRSGNLSESRALNGATNLPRNAATRVSGRLRVGNRPELQIEAVQDNQ